MHQLSYGNVTINFLSTQPTGRRQVPSSDGTTRLSSEWDIDIIGTLHPNILAFTPSVAPGAPTAAPGTGVPAFTSDRALRDYMMGPRRALVWRVATVPTPGNPSGIVTMLSVPAGDARFGPIPQEFSIVRLLSEDKTWLVRFRVKCWTNDCTNICLSNRWVMSEDVDDQHFAIRTIRGEAEFRLDLLNAGGLVADQLRANLIHPVPRGFHREWVHAEQSMDGATYRYEVIDEEDPSSLLLGQPNVASGITDLEAYQTNYVHSPGVAGAVGNILQSVGEFFGANPGQAAVRAVGRNLPFGYNHFLVKVWGNKSSTRRGLQRTALAVAQSRLNAIGVALASNSVEAYCTHDLRGRYVELSLTVQNNVLGLAGINGFLVNPTVAFQFPDGDSIDGITDALNPSVRLGMPNSNGTRGTYVENLICQALQAPCALPAAVGDLPRNQDAALQ